MSYSLSCQVKLQYSVIINDIERLKHSRGFFDMLSVHILMVSDYEYFPRTTYLSAISTHYVFSVRRIAEVFVIVRKLSDSLRDPVYEPPPLPFGFGEAQALKKRQFKFANVA